MALLVLALVAVVAMLVVGRRPELAPDSLEDPEAVAAPEGERPIRGEGFDYTQTRGGRAVFRLRGERIQLDREERVYLEEVVLVFFHDDGQSYHLSSKSAIYDPAGQRTDLSGQVRLEGPQGLRVSTEGIHMQDDGEALVSTHQVQLGLGPAIEGRADRLHLDLPSDTLTLSGSAEVRSRGVGVRHWTLKSDELRYQRPRRFLWATGGVRLDQEGSWLESERLEAEVTEDETALRHARARGDVEGLLVGLSPQRPRSAARYRGAALELHVPADEAPGERIVLVGDASAPAQATLRDVAAAPVRVQGGRLVVERSADDGVRIAGERGIRIVEHDPDPAASRQVRGREFSARVGAAGALEWVTVAGAVELIHPRYRATGERASFDWQTGHGELTGPEIRVVGDREEIVAQALYWTDDVSLLHASGGVRARLDGQRTAGLGAADLDDEPLFVHADRGFWRQQEPVEFLFEGHVRAWQGERLLLAEVLHGQTQPRRLTAETGVRTLWPLDGTWISPAGLSEQDRGSPADRVQVWADRMVFDEALLQITYTGNVRVRQMRQELEADQVEVELDEAGQEARQMRARGDVVFQDRARGGRATAREAEHDLTSGLLTLVGDPVELTDREGNLVRGPRLVYDTEHGTARFQGLDRADPHGRDATH